MSSRSQRMPVRGQRSHLKKHVTLMSSKPESAIWSSDTRGLFLESPGNLAGPKSYFEIKVSRKVGSVLSSNEVYFVSLADNFTVQI